MGLMVELSPRIGPALVVGGGAVALRKARGLVEAGFAVIVVAPGIVADLRALDGVTWRERTFEETDLEAMGLVFACTDSREVNRGVGEAARRRGIPVNVADRQEESTFSSAAVHRDGDLIIGVVTGGGSPRLSVAIRDEIAAGLGEGWDDRVKEAREQRETRLRERRGGQ